MYPLADIDVEPHLQGILKNFCTSHIVWVLPAVGTCAKANAALDPLKLRQVDNLNVVPEPRKKTMAYACAAHTTVNPSFAHHPNTELLVHVMTNLQLAEPILELLHPGSKLGLRAHNCFHRLRKLTRMAFAGSPMIIEKRAAVHEEVHRVLRLEPLKLAGNFVIEPLRPISI